MADSASIATAILLVLEEYPDLAAATHGNYQIQRSATDQTSNFVLRLDPDKRVRVAIDHPAMQTLSSHSGEYLAQLKDLLHRRVQAAGARLRGATVVDWLDRKLAMDWLDDLEPNNERAERLALMFAELSDALMRRAKREGA